MFHQFFHHSQVAEKQMVLSFSYSLARSEQRAFICLAAGYNFTERELAHIAEMNSKVHLYIINEYIYQHETLGMSAEEYNRFILDNSKCYHWIR